MPNRAKHGQTQAGTSIGPRPGGQVFCHGLWFSCGTARFKPIGEGNGQNTLGMGFGGQHLGVRRVAQPAGHLALGDAVGQGQSHAPLGQQPGHHLLQTLGALAVNHVAQARPQLRLHRRDEAVGRCLVGRFGGDAHVHLAGVSGQANGGVAAGHQIADEGIDLALADDAGAQDLGLDDPRLPHALLEIGDHPLGHEIFQLARDAGQADDSAAGFLYDEGGGGAHRVFDGHGALRDVRLASVVLGHLAAKASKAGRDLVQQVLAEDQRAAGGVGHCFAGDVVHGGSQPARDEHDIGAVQGDGEHGDHALAVVADGALVMQVQPNVAQHAGYHGGVGIIDFAEQQLGAGDYDFCVHSVAPS